MYKRKGESARFACIPSSGKGRPWEARTNSGYYEFGAIKDCGDHFEVEFAEASPPAFERIGLIEVDAADDLADDDVISIAPEVIPMTKVRPKGKAKAK